MPPGMKVTQAYGLCSSVLRLQSQNGRTSEVFRYRRVLVSVGVFLFVFLFVVFFVVVVVNCRGFVGFGDFCQGGPFVAIIFK